MTLANIDCAILCGGLGTRLGLRTRTTPKFLVPVAGRPFADYLFRFLERHGAQRVLLLAGHLSHAIADWVQDADHVKCDVELVPEETKLGTAGALRQARPRLRTEHVLVCNGDTLATGDFAGFVALAKERPLAEYHCRRFGKEHYFHTGFSLYPAKALDELAAADETDLVQWHRWRAYPIKDFSGKYLDLGSPRSYDKAQRIFPLWEPLD